ncbi:MAG TPA: hypothetical protein VI159_05680, partial [Gemmatimonadales bacterium]
WLWWFMKSHMSLEYWCRLFGTKGSQVQILSPRLKAAELLAKNEQSAASSFPRLNGAGNSCDT